MENKYSFHCIPDGKYQLLVIKFSPMRAPEAFSGRKEGRRCQSINKKEEETVQSTSKQSDPIYTRQKHRNGYLFRCLKTLDSLIIERSRLRPQQKRVIILALI